VTPALTGSRVPDNEWFERMADGLIFPGDYGCQEDGDHVKWFTCNPEGEIGWLAVHEPDKQGNFHTVTEHEDGTITVGGSIQGHVVKSENISGAGPISSRGGWHGWLERGVWRSA